GCTATGESPYCSGLINKYHHSVVGFPHPRWGYKCMTDYIGQTFSKPENTPKCRHQYFKCPEGCVWCSGPCGFWQCCTVTSEVVGVTDEGIPILGSKVPLDEKACKFHLI